MTRDRLRYHAILALTACQYALDSIAKLAVTLCHSIGTLSQPTWRGTQSCVTTLIGFIDS